MRHDRIRTTLFASVISILWVPFLVHPLALTPEAFRKPAVNQPVAIEPVSALSADRVRFNEVVQQTYLWSWPMVHLHNMRKPLRLLSRFGVSGGVPVAPINQICMLTDPISPEMQSIPCPNRDVLYGFGMLDLTDTAVVIQVPDFKDRLWVYQLGDLRTEALADLGSMHGTEPGFYLVVGPNWNGTAPASIKSVFRSPTNLAYLIPRVAVLDSAEDLAAAQAILPEILAYPLEHFNGQTRRRDWTKRKWYPNIGSSSAQQCKWVKPASFFDDLQAILEELEPHEHERTLHAQAKKLLNESQENGELRTQLNSMATQLESELIAPLFHFRNFGIQLPFHWTTVDNGANFGSDIYSRTAVARSNIFINQPSEAKYFHTDQSSTGELLHGDHQYRIRIAPSEIPPNHGFWSVTLYDEHHHLHCNSWKRYSIQSGGQLHRDHDGGITITVSPTPPENFESVNWLPAPRTNFSLYLRVYAPDASVINGDWTPPAVVKSSTDDYLADR